MGWQMLSLPRVAQRRIRPVVALLGGNLDELPLLRAASLARSRLDTNVELCWVDAQASPAYSLVRELAGVSDVGELSLGQFADQLRSGGVATVMLAPRLWRRVAGALWSRLGRASAYICRRAALPPASALCCADTEENARGLLGRLAAVLPEGSTRFTVLRAVPPPPSWAAGFMAMSGCFWPDLSDGGSSPAGPDGIQVMTVAAPAAAAAAAACSAVHPDLVVLGWHRHALPLPGRWSHPTAWRLSRSLPCDVLLVPLG
jgi:hypothetical protein